MITDLSRFFRNSLFLNVATILSGTILAQLIMLLFSPVLSRIYSPLEFGMFAIYSSMLAPLSTVMTGKYEQAIIIPEDERDSINIYAIIIAGSAAFAILIFVILLFFRENICQLLNAEKLGKWLYMIPVSLFLLSFSIASSFWFIRQKRFKLAAVNKIGQTAFNVSCSLPLGYLGYSNGLIVGDTVGKTFVAILSMYQTIKSGFIYREISVRKMLDNLKRFKQYPLYNTLPSLLVTICLSFPLFLISSFYSNVETGLVNQTRIAIFLPLSLISSAFSQVLLQRFSESRKKGHPIMPDFRFIMKYLLLAGFAIVVIIELFGVPLFRIVFGEKWTESGVYAKVLVFSYVIQFIVSPFSVIFIALNRIKLLSYWQFFYFISILLLYFAHFDSVVNFLFLYTILEFLCYMVFLYLTIHVIRDYQKGLA